MNQQLAEAVKALPLNPLIDPEPVSLWPPAIGWWLLLVLVIIVGLLLWFVGYRRYLQPALRLQRQRRRLREELKPLLLTRNPDTGANINRILKAHLLQLGHVQCKTLTGQQWQDYLVNEAGLKPAEADALTPLGDASYRPPLSSSNDREPRNQAFHKTVLLLARRLPRKRALSERFKAAKNG